MILPPNRIIRPNAGFIIPTPRFIDVAMPKPRVGMAGRYQLIVRDAWGVEKRRTPWFDNIILDAGLNRWGTGNPILGGAIGTGTSAPVATQTALDTQSTYTTTTGTGHNTDTAVGTSPYNNSRTFVFRTALGALNGNYSEVGVGWASGSMFSRALILDGGGTPTTISVGAAEQLDIVYQLQVFPPLVDTSNLVNISGVDYTVTGRAQFAGSLGGLAWPVSGLAATLAVTSINGAANAYSGALGAITANPSGTSTSNGSSAVVGAYVNNSLSRTGRSTLALAEGNVSGGIKSTSFFWNFAAFQYEFSPILPKNNTKTLTLDYSVTWARRP